MESKYRFYKDGIRTKKGVFKIFCWKHLKFGVYPPNPLYHSKMCWDCYEELKWDINKELNNG
jgi:hypothetical protein